MMDNLCTTHPLTEADAARIREHYERAERENREWLAARLHHALHNSWLSPDECATCLSEKDES